MIHNDFVTGYRSNINLHLTIKIVIKNVLYRHIFYESLKEQTGLSAPRDYVDHERITQTISASVVIDLRHCEGLSNNPPVRPWLSNIFVYFRIFRVGRFQQVHY